MPEIWELVDVHKCRTGVLHERGKESSIPAGMYHMVVDVWTVGPKGEVLLTQRHPGKHYGLMWECSGGSVIAGEDSRAAAVRELREETGLCAQEDELIFLGDSVHSYWIVDTYLYRAREERPSLCLQPGEVVDAKWIPVGEMDGWKDRIVDTVWERYKRFEGKMMIDTRCGLCCAECTYREPCHCGGCIATNGHPFHGECPVAICCQEKGFIHCGQCPDLPCALLRQYSIEDPEHGDTPPGARIEQCRKWKREEE